MSVRARWSALPSSARTAACWVAFVATSWLVLRPALVTTISGDDFLNPFYVFDDYGPSPLGMFRKVSVDLTHAGHFNHVGQNIGAIAYVLWAYLIGWGVRYSLIYATTKLVVLVLAAVAGARLLRRLSGLVGRELGLWRSRLVVAAGLFLTVQIHVAWSSDPVASFPLSGYASVAIGLLALDVCIDALGRDDRRSLVVGAVLLCLAIQYYEINVAAIVALAPIVWLCRRVGTGSGAAPAPWRPLLLRAGILVGPAVVMTLVLQAVAARANRGYTGTDVAVGDGTGAVVVRSLLGSFPASAWQQAHRWLGRGFSVSAGAAVTAVVAGTIVVAFVALARRRDVAADPIDGGAGHVPVLDLALVTAAPVLVWLAATLVQATTAKVRAETVAVGFVYNYYAYGSIGLVLAVALAGPPLLARLPGRARTSVRVVLVSAAVVVVGVQAVVNTDVQRTFGERLAVNDALLAAVSDRPPVEARCAAEAAWAALPFWQDYYRADMLDGIEALYEHAHGESFCPG